MSPSYDPDAAIEDRTTLLEPDPELSTT